jgi:hypothetical protein
MKVKGLSKLFNKQSTEKVAKERRATKRKMTLPTFLTFKELRLLFHSLLETLGVVGQQIKRVDSRSKAL